MNLEPTYKYTPPEKYEWINADDPDLVSFKVPIPEPPRNWEGIDGFGLPPEEQRFKKQSYPKKLQGLELKVKKLKANQKFKMVTVEDLQNYLYAHREDYAYEIDWMKKQWHHRLHGYWFFNNGKLTYMDGWMYFFLNYWHLPDGALPEYRDRDRRWFLAERYAISCTETFKDVDEGGRPTKNADGYYDFKDMGARVLMGTNNPKHRRSGETSKAECILCEIITRTMHADGGIQGMDGENGENVFQKHFVAPFKRLPWFFKPVYEGSTDPKAKINFKPPAVRVGTRGSVIDDSAGLNSSVDFAPTADRNFYDKRRLTVLHIDEPGKTLEEDVFERHMVLKNTLAQGKNIVGFMMNTTTVSEQKKRGGEAYFKLSELSHWETRDENGQTPSGLINVFFPAQDGLEGFVDDYGNSMIHEARLFLQNRRDGLKKSGNISALSEEKRLFPMMFRECFTPSADDVGFNVHILENRITELKIKPQTRCGNFVFPNGYGSIPEFIETPGGRFNISKTLDEGERGLRISRGGNYYPMHRGRYVASADPFKFLKTVNRKSTQVMSDGGGAVFMPRDHSIDPDTKSVDQWETHRFVCTYRHRPEKSEQYFEDMLAMCVYWGAVMYPEVNIGDEICRFFESAGHLGYLLFGYDNKGRLKDMAGFYTQEGNKQDLFNELRDYIQVHGSREKHLDLLKECLEIGSISNMTKYDLLTAGGGCMLAYKVITKQVQVVTNKAKVVKLFTRYSA